MRESFDGLVIRELDSGESDKILTVLTADRGKIVLTVKGARSSKSKLTPICRTFTYANFECYEKYGRRWLSGGEISESFFGLSNDVEGFALASYVIQLADEITGEGVQCEKVLRMTLNTLYVIENRLKSFPLVKSVYEIFASEESGVSPDLSGCSICGTSHCETDFWLDVMNGRIICAECQAKQSAQAAVDWDEFMTSNIIFPIDEGAISVWLYVLSAPPKRVFAFSLSSEDSVRMLSRVTEAYVVNHLEKSFETLEFYNSVKE